MRFYRHSILVGGLFLMALQASAQLNPRRNQGFSPPPSAINYEATKPDAAERAQENVNLYATTLEIDAFKKEVLKKYLEDYYIVKFDVTYDPNMKFDEKQTRLSDAKKQFEQQLQTVFTPEKTKDIITLDDAGAEALRKKEKKEKKRKKRKKKNKS